MMLRCMYIIFIGRAPQVRNKWGVEVLAAEASGEFLAMKWVWSLRHFTKRLCNPGAGLNTNLSKVIADHKAARNKKLRTDFGS